MPMSVIGMGFLHWQVTLKFQKSQKKARPKGEGRAVQYAKKSKNLSMEMIRQYTLFG